LVLLATFGLAISPTSEQPTRHSIVFKSGSMFISDAGSSHGGFEMTVEYSVDISPAMGTVIYTGNRVVLRFEREIGLGDPIYQHELGMKTDGGSSTVTIDYDPSADEVTLQMAKTLLRFEYVERDDVWDRRYDGHYIASWGGYAPPEEMRGSITPVFFGLPEHYYVEMRLELVITPIS